MGIHNKGIYISNDGGLSWNNFSEGIPDPYYVGNSFYYDSEYIYVGTLDNGLFKRPLSDLQFLEASGVVFHDFNENGEKESGEPGIFNNILIDSEQNLLFSDTAGSFAFIDEFDQPLTINIIQANPYAVYDPVQYIIGNPIDTIDFAVTFPGNEEDLFIDLTGTSSPRPGFETTLYLNIKNEGATPMDAIITLEHDNELGFLTAGPDPLDIDIPNSSLTWEINQLQILENVIIEVNFGLSNNTPLGQVLTSTAMVSPNIDDETPANNESTINAEVVGSYDPNDKQVDPLIYTTDDQSDELPLTYIVRFQNTGTYYAETVRIEDQIDENLNLETFKIVSASHPYRLGYKNPRTIDFIFEEINLPDSTTNEAASHGFIKYQIAPNSDLQVGELIENTASIYFDFNDPIITNTVQTILTVPTWVEESAVSQYGQLIISPNPNGGHFTVLIPGLENHTNSKLEMYNSLGQNVWAGIWEEQFDFTNLSNGVYLMKGIDSTGKIYSGKVLINKS